MSRPIAGRRGAAAQAAAAASSELYTQFCIGVELGDDVLVRDLVQRGADPTVSYGVDGVVTTPIQSALAKGDLAMTLALLSSRAVRVRLSDIDSAPKVKRDLVTPILARRLSEALESDARQTLLQRVDLASQTIGKSVAGTRGGRGGGSRTANKLSVKAPLPEIIGWYIRTEANAVKIAHASSVDNKKFVDDDDEGEDEEESTDETSDSPDVESLTGSLPMASKTDRVRCPPPGLLTESDDAPVVKIGGKNYETDSEGDVEENEEDEETDDGSVSGKSSTLSSAGDDSMIDD